MNYHSDFSQQEIWFVTGSQLLYGEETLKKVDSQSRLVVDGLNRSGKLPFRIVYKGTVKSSEEIEQTLLDANHSPQCVGVITWMHTFSPAKMWIRGLKHLHKPLLHLHTQFQREIPWSEIDMDYMNLNQSAHGDREFGHILSKMRIKRKVVVGYWEEPEVLERIAVWMRVCAAWSDSWKMRIIRFGDNMNNVAVTDGDKVEAEIVFGYHVDYYPIGNLVAMVQKVSDAEIDRLMAEYETLYIIPDSVKKSAVAIGQVREAARMEIGIRNVLAETGAKAFTTNFDALHGLNQLPGLASQRLMNAGFGFGAEGDWKTAALVRTLKVMASGLTGGTSFIEDYVYHFVGKGAALQAHMLEICPSLAKDQPQLEVHPLGIGGKADPARLVFNATEGPGIAATVIDLGNRFRLITNRVDCIAPEAPLPKLPVARGFWIPQPNLQLAAQAWLLAGGTHHTAFSYALTSEYFDDFAEIAGIELLQIDNNLEINAFKHEMQQNDR